MQSNYFSESFIFGFLPCRILRAINTNNAIPILKILRSGEGKTYVQLSASLGGASRL